MEQTWIQMSKFLCVFNQEKNKIKLELRTGVPMNGKREHIAVCVQSSKWT
jgi:hypothetical protein